MNKDEEHVLVVPESVVQQIGYFEGFESDTDKYLNPILSSDRLSYQRRGEMETDPSFKQLIPYVVLQWSDNGGNAKVFTYTRGGGGGEKRLHAKRSIGIGGHISLEDANEETSGQADAYHVGMRRELDEEINLQSEYEEHVEGLIYDPSNEVGKVHLGVVHRFVLDRPDVESNESDLAEGGFVDVAELKQDIDPARNLESIGPQSVVPRIMIYLDNHATTKCDPRAVEVMLPWFTEHFGNPHSTSHAKGREAAEIVEQSRQRVASAIDCPADSIIWTSGATESNNLAIRGVCLHPRQKRRHLVTVTNEHHAVLDVIEEFGHAGWRVTVVPVHPNGHDQAGCVDMEELARAIDEDTALVSVMWANNEIGSINPMAEIAQLCHSAGALLHCDATQAVGRIPVSVVNSDIDLLSATGHKLYGPKGSGMLVVGNGNRRVRLRPEITGGGQQQGLRSGTVPPAGVVGFSTALAVATQEVDETHQRVDRLRQRLWERLSDQIQGLEINGIPLDSPSRLPGNLNLMLPDIEGEAWMTATPEICFSSGSACSSVEPKPSHVLTAIGLDESMARRSVRFGIGKFNTENEIDTASELLVEAYRVLSQRSPA